MTTPVQRRPDCLDDETLAAFVDGTLAADARAGVIAHLADCANCHEVVVETQHALAGMATTPSVPARPPVTRRWWVIGGLAAAASVAYLTWNGSLTRDVNRRVPSGALGELVTATGNQRATIGRLAGGFAWAPAPDVQRAGSAETRSTPELDIARAHAEQALRTQRTADSLLAAGTADAVTGRLNDAVNRLDEAVALAPASEAGWTSLSATLLTRSRQPGRAADVPRALEAAERALSIRSTFIEAAFNRALALELLGMKAEAIASWNAYLALDSNSPWAAEARQHLQRLQASSGSRADPQRERDTLLDEVLPAWAKAEMAGDRVAETSARERAMAISAAISDALTVVVVGSLARPANPNLPAGILAYSDGRQAFASGQYEKAVASFARSRTVFVAAANPLAEWASLNLINTHYRMGELATAQRLLDDLARQPSSVRSASATARAEWLRGLLALTRLDHDAAAAHYARAREGYTQAQEWGNVAAIRNLEAENFDLLGRPALAWMTRQTALPDAQLYGTFLGAAVSARRAGWPHVARVLAEAGLARSQTGGRPKDIADALRAVGTASGALGEFDAAEKRFSEAQTLLETQSLLSDRSRAEIDAARALFGNPARPEQMVQAASSAVAYFTKAGATLRLPDLLLARASAHLRQHGVDAARADLSQGLDILAQERARVSSGPDRVTFDDQVRRVTDALVTLEAGEGDVPSALRAAELGRTKELTRSWPAGRTLDVAEFQRELSPRTVVAYYELHDDRAFVAVIRRQDMSWTALDLNRAQIARLIEDFRDAPSAATGASVRRALLKNVDAVLGDDDLLVIIPDGVIGLLPFAALPGRHSPYLIQENAVLFAPGARAFLDASRRTQSFAGPPSAVSALGAGSAVVTEEGEFPALPASEGEVRDVAALYPSARASSSASTATFVDALQGADVVHFAGHAWLDGENPWRSQLVLPASPDAAPLTASVLERMRVGKTRLVMLSACEGSAGLIARSEGPLSLARSLLAAGVPTVVASNQRVADQAARSLAVAFHREYRATGDPATALRRAQEQQIIRASSSSNSPIDWASFVAVGGTPSALQSNDVRDRSR